MAIGSNVETSIPVVGTLVNDLLKLKAGLFAKTLTVSSEDAPVVLTLRASSVENFNFKQFGLSYKYNPSINDSQADARSGSITCAINVNAQVGAVLTKAVICNHIRYALSAALESGLIEALYDGSLE